MPARLLTAPPVPNLLRAETEVAPVMGMDGTVPLHNMPPGTAVYLYNLLPSEYGCRTPPGNRVWAQGLAGGGVRSILPFTSETYQGVDNKLFGVTPSGIYDCTVQGTDTPAADVVFGDTSQDAGFCSFIHHTDPNGDQALLIADARNGMYLYDPSTAMWTKYTTEITGADPSQVAFLMNHKGRIWLIERDSSDAWYLPIGARAGAATKFQFGSKMKHGGYLVGLYSWSVDGGDGIDDYLLAVSKGGDVLVYRGSDPSASTTWDLVGRFFIGQVPENRRIATETGGDTLLLSVFGLTSVQQLLSGVDPAKIERNITAKISRIIRDQLQQKVDLPYWEVKPLMAENILNVNSPRLSNQDYIQYALNINRVAEQSGGGWAMIRGVPATTFESYNGTTYFGTESGEIYQVTGSLRNVDIAGNGGVPIGFSMLGRFTNYESSVYKQVAYLRPSFITNNKIDYTAKPVYDFNLDEIAYSSSLSSAQSAAWDVAIWDQSAWSGVATNIKTIGAKGKGVSVAVALRGETVSRATLVNTALNWQQWDFL